MLPVSIETLRVRIGLDAADASRDEDINLASDTALSLMGSYCDRIFMAAVDYTEIFTHRSAETIPLIRYPVSNITSITDSFGQTVTLYHLAADRGTISLDFSGRFHEVTIVYDGGYAEGEFPADLLLAFNLVFDQQFTSIDSGPSTGERDIDSVTVPDVGTVRYSKVDTGYMADGAAFLSAQASDILQAYVRYQC